MSLTPRLILSSTRQFSSISPTLTRPTPEQEPERPPPTPPPVPKPTHLTHYSTTSTTSALAHSLILASKDARAGAGFLLGTVKNPFPLELVYKELKGGMPTADEWKQMIEFMQEQEEAKSLQSNPPAILITPHSPAIPKSFTPPMLVNWTDREVYHGPYVYSQLESAINRMRTNQKDRMAAEAAYDAYLISKGKRPPSRQKPETDRIKWWEVGLVGSIALVALDWFYEVWGDEDE